MLYRLARIRVVIRCCICACAAATLLLGAVGCGKRDGIVGTWRAEQDGPRGITVITIEFRPDGTETQRIEMGGRMVEIQAKYRVTKNLIIHTLESATRDGAAINPRTQTVSYEYKLHEGTLSLLKSDGSVEMVMERVD